MQELLICAFIEHLRRYFVNNFDEIVDRDCDVSNCICAQTIVVTVFCIMQSQINIWLQGMNAMNEYLIYMRFHVKCCCFFLNIVLSEM